jgi:hypothetical protein
MKDLLNSCVFPSADGSVKGFVKDIDRFDQITDMTKTFGEDFNAKYLPTLDAAKNSIAIKEFNAYILDKLVTGKVSDFRSRSSEDPLALMDAQNKKTTAPNISCAWDRLAYHSTDTRCNGYPLRVPADAVTFKNGSDETTDKYCIVMPEADGYGFNARYPTGHCANGISVELVNLATVSKALKDK